MAVLQTPTFTTPERASSLLQPLRDFMPERRLAYAETPTAFADICTGHDAGFPDETHGFYVYGGGGMLRPPLADGLIDGLVELMSRPPSPQSLVLMFTLPRSSNIAGALDMHDRVNICLIACWSSATPEIELPRFKAWIDEGRRLLRSFGDVRMYIHESTLSSPSEIRSAFDDAAWNRIKALKAQLDGDGVFLPLDYYGTWC